MAEGRPVEDDEPSWCIISLMVTFNAVLNLCHALSFLWIFFFRLKLKFKDSGGWWIFSNCIINIIQFFVMTNFTFRYFKNRIPRKALTICLSFSFGLLLCLQLASLIIGSVKYRTWTVSSSKSFHTTFLVYLILSWCFMGALLIVILVCCLVDCCRRRRRKEEEELLLDEEKCCCRRKSDRECCSRCNRCCIGYEVDPTRERINNSCCCDCCCSCCIDCCIDCCGEKKVRLPDSITDNDIVVINSHHRVIYAPDPNAPVTMSSTNQNLAGLAGVGSFQNNDRHFLPAVFYSDVTTAEGTKTPLYIIPSDIPNQQTLFSNTMAPVIPVESNEIVEPSNVSPRNTPQYVIIDGVKYILRT